MSLPAFMEYNTDQLFLPEDLGSMISPGHVVRIVSGAVDRMADSMFEEHYPGGGRASYHPKMMTKVLVYAYTQRLYSSRQIAKACREQIPFLWLSARQTPDFRTLNRFRGERLKDLIDEVFSSVLALLVEEGHVRLEHYFVDGTKLEANAGRYTFVWKKSTERRQEQVKEQAKELLREIEAVNAAEDAAYADRDLEELGDGKPITAEKLDAVVKELQGRLGEKPKDPNVRKAVRKLKKDILPRLRIYEAQQETFGERKSFSKTDPDATFMRMKEDHMGNGQLKPAYNAQVGTEGQFIVGYSLHQRPGDVRCLIPHLDEVRRRFGVVPRTIIADAGYGSEENYRILARRKTRAFVKFKTFDLEKTRRFQTDVSRIENWDYDPAKDEFRCKAGRRLLFLRESMETTESGHRLRKRFYRSEGCDGCPIRDLCTKAPGDRIIQVSFERQRFEKRARDLLLSPDGQHLIKRRMTDVESVFGQIKGNRGFRRFSLRGLTKTHIEFGLVCIAHNLLKRAAVTA